MNWKTTLILFGMTLLYMLAIDVGRLPGQGIADEVAGEYANVNGMRMYYETYGKGEPLLLLHWYGASGHQSWDPFLKKLSARYRVVLPDLRGHGQTLNPGNSFTHRQSAKDVYALLDSLGIKKFKAMGVSTGGMTLLHMATGQPDRVRTMVLVVDREQVRCMNLPTLILSGGNSDDVGKFTDPELERLIPARLRKRVVLEEATHLMWSEQPEECRRAVLDFIRGQ